MRLNTLYVINELATYLRENGFRVYVLPSYTSVDHTRLIKPCVVLTPDTTSITNEIGYISVEDDLTLYCFTATPEEMPAFVTSVAESLINLEMVENHDVEFQPVKLEIPEIQWSVLNDVGVPLAAIGVKVRHLSP